MKLLFVSDDAPNRQRAPYPLSTPPSHNRVRTICLAAPIIGVVVILAMSAALFVRPRTDKPRRSNAIVVLQGSGPRISKGLALARAGYAPYLVISDPSRSPCPATPRGVKAICFVPVPLTTQGEARATARLARHYRWHQIIVVSGTPQTTRARVLFQRCYHGTLLFDPASPQTVGDWIHNVLHEWGALPKALALDRAC